MAQGKNFNCSSCGWHAAGWDEGLPYYFKASGEKRYAPHPYSDHHLCTGTEDDFACRACGAVFRLDRAAKEQGSCPDCESTDVVALWFMPDGSPCPRCKADALHLSRAIS